MAFRRPVLTVLLCLCAAWIALHQLRVLAFADVDFAPLSSRFAHVVVLVVAAGLCLARAALVRRERAAWLLIGAGVAGWTFGELYYTAVLWDYADPPIPSPADVGFLSFPVLMLAGMVTLVRARAKFSPALFVDGAAAALAVASVSAAIVFQAALEHVEGDGVNVATVLAYPLTDCILLAVGVGALAGTGWRLDRSWMLLAGGILAFWFADAMYLVRTAENTWVSGSWLDAGWWAGLTMVAAAAWQRPPSRRVRCNGDNLRLLIAPLVSGAVALELLVYASTGSLNALAVGLAAAALMFVMIRLTLTFRQNVRILRASRNEALTDVLTGLGNRRALTRALDDALPESPLVLTLFDLDGFKQYNDTFGHQAGDVLLARLGGNLSAYFGHRARVFRMGGDEFCALFEPRGADVDGQLEGAALALSEQGDGVWIGCSFGAVTLPKETADASEALRIADQRMYAQKHAGRVSPARQVKESLMAALAARDPRLEADARALGDVADAAARALGLNRDEREPVRLAAELHQVGRLAATNPADVARASERIVTAAPSLAAVARLLRALRDDDAPVGAQIVAVAALGAKPHHDPAVVRAVAAAQPALV